MKILSAKQQSALDSFTIKKKKIRLIDLMEDAANAFYREMKNNLSHSKIHVFCGKGNNGGDGLAIARIMQKNGFKPAVYVLDLSTKPSAEFLENERQFQEVGSIHYIRSTKQILPISKNDVVIDALLGTGGNRPAEGFFADAIRVINKSGASVFSVDMPSGLYCEQSNNINDEIVKATSVFTFHAPKLSFFYPQNYSFVPSFVILDIGLDKEEYTNIKSDYNTIEGNEIKMLIKKREKFSHKGTYGHALIAAGSTGKNGAAILAVRAALRSGAGLVTSLLPLSGVLPMQIANPEAMVAQSGGFQLSEQIDYQPYSAIALGPGIGTSGSVKPFFYQFLKNCKQPLVLDADALNLIAVDKKLLSLLQPNTILTPHPGEFKRLVGEWKSDKERLDKQIAFSKKYKVIIVLKGANTTITEPNGKVYFNTTGNPGMAKGGSGDVLTGVIAALLAQNYTPTQSAQLGVYVHGLAGDLASEYLGEIGMNAGDIVLFLPKAFKAIS